MEYATRKKIENVRKGMIQVDLPKSDFTSSELENADVWDIYDTILDFIVPIHGKVAVTDELYVNNNYPDQEIYRLESCEDGYEYLIHAYHYSDTDGYGAELFAKEELKNDKK